MKNRSYSMTEIDLGLDMDTDILNIYMSQYIVICIKQHVSNIWSSIHDKVKQHWGWAEKKHCL